jgi:integrase
MTQLTTLHKNTSIQKNTLSVNDAERLNELELASKSKNTDKKYDNALKQFINAGFSFPTTSTGLQKFILILEDNGCQPSTIEQYVTAVASKQKNLGFINPYTDIVKTKISGLKRLNPSSNRKGEILSTQELFTVCKMLYSDNSIKNIRNRALFLTALWSCSRTEEVADFCFEKTTFDIHSISLSLAKTKTKQEGQGEIKIIPKLSKPDEQDVLCPWQALEDYKEVMPYHYGGLFKRFNKNGKFLEKSVSHRSIRGIIKEILISAGIDEQRAAKINGHSFRHTIADLGSQIGLSTQAIQKLGGWKSAESVSRYSGEHNIVSIKKISEYLNSLTSD